MSPGRRVGPPDGSPLGIAAADYKEKRDARRRLERKKSEIPWWRIQSRKAASSELSELESTDRLDDVSAVLARELILACVRDINGARVWRQRTEDELAALTDQVTGDMGWRLEQLGLANDNSMRVLLQADQVLETIRMRIREVQDAVADPQCVTHESAADGKPHLVIQHVATGLRAEFIDNGDGFGSVNAKPFRIPSICSESPNWPDWWRDYVGLGVGARLYLTAQEHWPNLRWAQGTLTGEASRPLRVKLHGWDPFVWQGDCHWCRRNVAEWRKAVPGDLVGHPNPERG